MPRPPVWDVFCRVIDHWGDIGVCWRLAADLASRGVQVRLWADDASALAWMAPNGAPGVEVRPWAEAETPGPADEPGDVVIEAFACDPPPAFVAAMAARPTPPVWINLEYLSAEDWVERCHGLPSPRMTSPGRGLTKWFFHPGFTAATGGLLREPGLLEARRTFDRTAWLAGHGVAPRPGEAVVVVFCYPHAPLPALPAALAAGLQRPVLMLLAQGAAQALAQGMTPEFPGVRLAPLPALDQQDFDRLLWSADLAFVRGEDSAVRAIWAGVPFVWQLYRQDDGAHVNKMEAFLARWRAAAGASAELSAAVAQLWGWWNGLTLAAPAAWPEGPAWVKASVAFRDSLRQQPDLASALMAFARDKAAPSGPAG